MHIKWYAILEPFFEQWNEKGNTIENIKLIEFIYAYRVNTLDLQQSNVKLSGIEAIRATANVVDW